MFVYLFTGITTTAPLYFILQLFFRNQWFRIRSGLPPRPESQIASNGPLDQLENTILGSFLVRFADVVENHELGCLKVHILLEAFDLRLRERTLGP